MLTHSTYPVIIPAAGIGSRMQATCAKQYLKINQKTILEHTIDVFLCCPSISEVIVVLHPEDVLFETLAVANNKAVRTVIGGNQRVDSVLAGLHALSETQQSNWVLVHDAARPCLHQDDLSKIIKECTQDKHSGGILAVPVADTIKQQGENKAIAATIDRSLL